MFVLKQWIQKGRKTTFYTVWKEDSKENETNKFFRKHKEMPDYKSAVQILANLLVNEIGNQHGAKDAFFNRDEEGAFGLPPKGKAFVSGVVFHFPEFPLRLYAMRIGDKEDLVVLFNGGIKSSQKNIDSDLHHNMQEAKVFVTKIDTALQNGTILINEKTRELENADGSTELLFY